MATKEELEIICNKAVLRLLETLNDGQTVTKNTIYPYIAEAYAAGMQAIVPVLESAMGKLP